MPLNDIISLNEQNNESNVVEYCIYSKNTTEITGELLNSILIFVNCECRVSDYIWQGDSFNLAKRNSKDSKSLAHLYGKSYFGDNIEDEWFIVHILYEISKKFEDLIMQVCDEDGEFLLIEAADHLPKWLDPDNADNRVFIHQGNLHIISKNLIPTAKNLNIIESLKILTNSVSETLAETNIRNCIENRIKGFPERIKLNQHTATCFIPATLATILTTHPSLISPIIRSFFEHEADDLKFCSTFKFFKPSSRVNIKVKMTRCLYAQLTQRSFPPNPTSEFSTGNSSTSEKACSLGIKLTNGAEILCTKSELIQIKNNKNMNRNANSFNEENKHWKSFTEKLKKSGFFGGEMEGSKRYKEQLEQAKLYFISSFLPNILSKTDTANNGDKKSSDANNSNYNAFNYEDVGGLLLYLLDKAKKNEENGYDDGEDKRRDGEGEDVDKRVNDDDNKNRDDDVDVKKGDVDVKKDDDVSDDDSWINICPEELERILKDFNNKTDLKKENNSKGENDDLDFNLGVVNEKVKSFVGHESGHLGVEVANEASGFDSDNDEDTDGGDDEFENDNDDEDDDDNDINFDADSFLKAMGNILTVTKLPDNDDGDDGYEYDNNGEYDEDDDEENDDERMKDLSPTITDYISLMDKELSKTSIGKSFVNEDGKEDESINKNSTTKQKKPPVNIIYADDDEDDDREEFKHNADDDKLQNNSKHSVGNKKNDDNKDEDDDDNDDDGNGDNDNDDDNEIDVDYNLMKNLLESFSSQNGLSGPSTTVLKSLGLYLPPKK